MSQAQALIDAYEQRLGEEIAVGEWLEIDQQRIDGFAKVTGDEQWIHTDPSRAAKESPYGTTIAHGFLTLSLLPLLTRGNDPEQFAKNYPGMRLRVNYGLDKVRFPSPVQCGARLRARSVVKDVSEVKGGVQLIMTLTIEIDGEAKPACVAEQIFRLYP